MAEKFPYEDIIHLPPHISRRHPQPTMMDRAARFTPFAAITGYEEMVLEEARVTDEWVDLTESALEQLNERLALIREHLSGQPVVTVTYFEPDPRKAGGAYLDHTGVVKRIDLYERQLVMAGGKKIDIAAICKLHGELFAQLDEMQ